MALIYMIYISKNLCNVCLNGKQLDSHIWFFIQSFADITHYADFGKFYLYL